MSVDVVGIGALNFDYVIPDARNPEQGTVPGVEAGAEVLDFEPLELQERIRDYCVQHPGYRLRFGGSAYLAIKTIESLPLNVSTGFVGITGTPQQLEHRLGWNTDLDRELTHLRSQEWVFRSLGHPGRALICLHGGKRQWIGIAPGANEELWKRISEREAEGKDFTEYLASARWVHLTSLRDFSQFLQICERLREAKRRNRHLRVSIDPGHEYTTKHALGLLEAFKVADFVFLNQNEFSNLMGDKRFPIQSRLKRLHGLVPEGAQVLVVKYKRRHELLQVYRDGFVPYRYWHRLVWRPEDDTGAGDVFAGGFIAGMLTPQLLGQQPAPILLGAKLAATKLQSKEFPGDECHAVAGRFVRRAQARAHLNLRQWMSLYSEVVWNHLIAFAIGLGAGIAANWLFRHIFGP
jgi:sugar/nucleoside kinase (ribokinase family)